MKKAINILALALVVLSLAPQALADSIEIRSSARIEPTEPVRLADVAVLEGSEAVTLADVVVIENASETANGGTWIEIQAEDIRQVLRAHGANLSRLSISGSSCTARLAATHRPTRPVASKIDVPRRHEVVEDVSRSTMRSRVAEAIGRLLGAQPTNLRLLFARDDEDFLRQTTWGRRVAVQPTTSGNSSNVLIEVRVFSATDARLLERRRLRVEAEVRRIVLVMQDGVRRGSRIAASDVELRELWMKVDGSAPVESADQAIGSVARRRIDAGKVLRASDLEPPILIERGQMVTVHCLRSGFAVKSRARAASDGRLGDVIEFKLDGSKRSFTARVDGPGEAVIDMDRHDQPRRQESD
jgi:flagella basal body P-ring formation protein FlgA